MSRDDTILEQRDIYATENLLKRTALPESEKKLCFPYLRIGKPRFYLWFFGRAGMSETKFSW